MNITHTPPTSPHDPLGDDKIIMSKRSLIVLIVSLALGMFVLVSGIFYFLLDNKELVDVKKQYDAPSVIELSPENFMGMIDTTEEVTTTEPIILHTDSIFSKYIETKEGKNDFSSSLKGQDIVIDWYQGARPLDDKQDTLIQRLKERIDVSMYDEGTNIGTVYGFVAGVIKEPLALAGQPLYLVSVAETGMFAYYSDQYVIYDESSDRFVFIYPNNDYPRCTYNAICKDFVSYDFKEIKAPTTLDIPEDDGNLLYVAHVVKDGSSNTIWEHPGLSENKGGVIDVENVEIATIPAGSEILFTDPVYGPVYVVGDQFQIVMPDGSIKIYDYVPYFFSYNHEETEARKGMYEIESKLNVTWYEGYDTNEKFLPAGDVTFGCGAGVKSFPNIVDDKEWFDEKDLIPVAETVTGEKMYAIKDPSKIKYYKDVYDIGIGGAMMELGSEAEEMSDEEKWEYFLNDTALIYWKDSWGNWRAYRKAKYKSLAECGKPVIYLYPEQDSDVHVQVEPDGGFSITEPAYGDDGWFVHASIDSELHNYADGKNYEYLFWEGYSYDYEFPCYGFFMSRDEVPTRMYELLEKLGMNKKESDDFMEFWEDKLTVSPYVYVTFLDQKIFDRMAPLTVDPAPDTVIRVFMDYVPLDEPMYVDEPYIRTPKREGFTVVEWGGRLH